MYKDINRYLKALGVYIDSAFSIIAGACSILSIVLLVISDAEKAVYALCALCLCLVIIMVCIIKAIRDISHKEYDKDYKILSSFHVYQSSNNTDITYETISLVQNKRTIAFEYPYKFKWSGDLLSERNVTTKTHSISSLKFNTEKTVKDELKVRFDKPLTYNECSVIDVLFNICDPDKHSKPFIGAKVEYPIELVLFRALLQYKDSTYNRSARLLRRPIESEVTPEWEVLEYIPFNTGNKLYQYSLINPEVGYHYRLEWERD